MHPDRSPGRRDGTDQLQSRNTNSNRQKAKYIGKVIRVRRRAIALGFEEFMAFTGLECSYPFIAQLTSYQRAPSFSQTFSPYFKTKSLTVHTIGESFAVRVVRHPRRDFALCFRYAVGLVPSRSTNNTRIRSVLLKPAKCATVFT